MTETEAPAAQPASLVPVLSLAVVLITFRSVVWIAFEQAAFDSDQAIIGLMAKHLGEGRAFPLFFYGQHYMLGVEAFLVAPFVAIAGASVATIKLPLLLVNIGIAALLLWQLVRRLRLAPWEAFFVSSFFIVAPALASQRLVEAQGSNIEPLLYVLLLWELRERPVAFGLLAGLAFFHREFAAYAVAAVVAVDVLGGRAFTRERLRDYAVSWGMFALVAFVVNSSRVNADLLGPGTAGSVASSLDAQVSSWHQFVCWPPKELTLNLAWLFRENLGTLFNWKTQLWGAAQWRQIRIGYAWMGLPLGIMALVSGLYAIRGRRHLQTNWQFGIYLMLIGLQAAGAYAVLGCLVRDGTLVRYTLLTLFFPVGLLTLFVSSSPPTWARSLVFGLVALWALGSLVDNGRILAAFIHRPPPSSARGLVDFLESNGVKYARGSYWVAYQTDLLSQERITVSSIDKVRVAEYQTIVDEHDDQAVLILENPEWPAKACDDGVGYRMWCVQYLERGRNRTSPGRQP